jgi:hypothetical protein
MFCQFDPKKEKKKEGAQHLYIYNFESNVTCAQYWILNMQVWISKMVLAPHFCTFCCCSYKA